MIYVFLVLAAGLGVAVLKTDGGVRIFLACCLALNLLAAGMMIYDDFPYAWRLAPNDWLSD